MKTNPKTWKVLVLCFSLFTLYSLSGCTTNGNSLENGDFEKELVFFEQWVRIKGEAGPPYIFIDFPTYRFDEEKGMLISFQNVFGEGEGKINPALLNLIVGEGTSLAGSAGSGAASDLRGVTDFPFTTNYRSLTVKEMKSDGTLILEPLNEEITFLEFVFPNPIPRETFALKPGKRLEYTVTRTFLFGGKQQKLTLTVTLRSAFLERTHCINRTWGTP